MTLRITRMNMKTLIISALGLASLLCQVSAESSKPLEPINWQKFMAQQDLRWERVPDDWLKAPYLGNGMVGLLLFQEKKTSKNLESTGEKNLLHLHLGRGDYNDNRPPVDGREHGWIYRGRLPAGFFRIRSKGEVTDADWRMDLWNATLSGTVTTTEGSYAIEGLVHADFDSFYFKVTPSGGEDVKFEWQPQKCYSYPRIASENHVKHMTSRGEEPRGPYKTFEKIPYPEAPEVEVEMNPKGNFSRQALYAESGELVVAWNVNEDASDGSRTLLGTTTFSQKMGAAKPAASANMRKAMDKMADGSYMVDHRAWWNAYYPQSFISISDDFWEQFYWIQMYKFASATRSDGMLLDVMGPWYQPGFWPLIWTDLNVQLTYWTHLTANRLDVGSSLMNQTDKYSQNLINNVHEDWQEDCLNADTIFPYDMKAKAGKKVADHMIWMLHNYWLQCRYADDPERMRDGLFPLLKRALNSNLRYLEENPLDLGDGKIHFKHTWSPEYPGGTGVDVNYTLALSKWAAETLLELNEAHGLNDPKAEAWKELIAKLPDYPKDENGLRIGREIPFDKSHRHYSHLLAFYPLFDLTPENDHELLKTSVDHWLAVAQNLDKKTDTARNVTGYTCTGGASMYAALGDGDTGLHYLRMLPFNNVSCTTMYAEGNPVIESPFSAATSIHDMLLLSYGDRIRIMPGVPSSWEDIQYRSLLCQGGAEVTADRAAGKLRYARIDSPGREREIVFSMKMKDPAFFVLNDSGEKKSIALKEGSDGFYSVKLSANASLVAVAKGGDPSSFKAVKSSEGQANIFGYNAKYDAVVEGFEKEAK